MHKISLIIINFRSDYLSETYKSVKSQSLNLWDAFILSTAEITNQDILSDSKIQIIYIKNKNFIFKNILNIIQISTGDFLSIITSGDILHKKRLELQSEFIITNSLNISSCLETQITNPDSEVIQNQFITSQYIDYSCNSGFIPINIYTLMFKKTFLFKIYKILLKSSIKSELDLVLLLLKYTKIEKIPLILHYFKTNIIPYTENLHLDNNFSSSNPINFFIENKFIENRNFLIRSLDKYTNGLSYRTTYNFNVLVVLSNLRLGGTETYILEMIKSFKKLGINTLVLTKGGLLEDIFLLNNIKILKSKLWFKKEFFKDEVLKIIDKFNINLIHCHMPYEIELCETLNKKITIPIFATLHGTYYKKNLITKAKKYIDTFIVVSSIVNDFYFTTLESPNIKIVPNSINFKKDLSVYKLNKDSDYKEIFSTNKKVILYCSRLSSNKGKLAIKFLKTFDILQKNYPNIIAIIAGDGNYRSEIEKLALSINNTTSSKEKKVFVIGSVFDIKSLCYNSWLTIGTGRVALESLCVKTPVITLGLSTIPNIVSTSTVNTLIKTNFGDHTHNLKQSNDLYDPKLTNLIKKLLDNPREYDKNKKNFLNKPLNILDISNSSAIIANLYKNKS